MGDPVTMALVGAGIGGGTSLIKGKSLGKSLKNAAIGGTLGYGGGLAGQGLGLGGAAANAGTVGEILPGTIESSGMVFNPATGSYLAPEAYLGAGTSMPVFTGGEGLLSNGISGLTDMMPQSLSEVATPKNLLGVAQVMSAMPENKAPLQNIGGGQISHGQMPQYVPFNTGTTQTWKKRNQ